MDNKRLVIGMVLAMAVVMGWQYFISYMYQRNPSWKPQPQETAQTTPPPASSSPTTDVGLAPSTSGSVEAVAPTTGTTVSTRPATSVRLANAATQPARVELGASDPKGDTLPLKLDLNSRGAGIDLATLKEYKARGGKSVYTFQSPPNDDPHYRPLATQWVTVNGSTAIQLSGLNWNLDSSTDRSATFSLELSPSGTPLVRVRKTFEIFDATHAGKGYEVSVRQTFENLTDQPLRITTTIAGPVLPPMELDRPPDRQIIAGYVDGKQVEAKQALVEEFKDTTPRDFARD